MPPETPSYTHVAIGASAGGIHAVAEVLGGLPGDFPLPILVVLHLSARFPSSLPELWGKRTALSVEWARDGAMASPGTVHVAPPDRHLLLGRDGRLALCGGDRVRWWRPAVDRLFETAARSAGAGAIGVVMSGLLWDGTRGIAAIREAGGLTIAQDERSCAHFDMPASAIDFGRADMILSPARIAEALRIAAALETDPSPMSSAG